MSSTGFVPSASSCPVTAARWAVSRPDRSPGQPIHRSLSRRYTPRNPVARPPTLGFTTAWPSWTLVENAHAWHDQPFADQENGFKGLASQLKINGPFGLKMMTTLARWQQEGIYTYSGRGSKGDQPIINGEAAIGLASTALAAPWPALTSGTGSSTHCLESRRPGEGIA